MAQPNVAVWLRNNPKILQRFAELITVNGGEPTIRRIVGQATPSEANRYGRIGLTPAEAVELAYIHGGFDILAMLGPDAARDEARGLIDAEAAGEVASAIMLPTPEEAKLYSVPWSKRG